MSSAMLLFLEHHHLTHSTLATLRNILMFESPPEEGRGRQGEELLDPSSSSGQANSDPNAVDIRRSACGYSKLLRSINSSLYSKEFLASWRSCRTLFGVSMRQDYNVISGCSLMMVPI